MGYMTFHWVHDPGLEISLWSAFLPQMGEWACASEDRMGAKPNCYWFLLCYWPPQGCLGQLGTLAVVGLCFAWACDRVKYCPSQRLKWLSHKEQKAAVSTDWANIAIFVSSTFLCWHRNYCFLRRQDNNVASKCRVFCLGLTPGVFLPYLCCNSAAMCFCFPARLMLQARNLCTVLKEPQVELWGWGSSHQLRALGKKNSIITGKK